MKKIWLAYWCLIWSCTAQGSSLEDSINLKREVNQTLTKMKFDTIKVCNDTKDDVILEYALFSKTQRLEGSIGWDETLFPIVNNSLSSSLISLSESMIKGGAALTLSGQKEYYLAKVRLQEKNLYLGMQQEGNTLLLSIKNEPQRYPLKVGSFAQDGTVALKNASWHRDYALNFQYNICPQEGFNFHTYYAWLKRNFNLYDRRALLSDTPAKLKIPLKTHTVWPVLKGEVEEFKKSYAHWLAMTMRACPPAEGWQHYIWMFDKKLSPETVKHPLLGIDEELEKHIIIKEFKEVETPETLQRLMNLMIARKQKHLTGLISDIIRYLIVLQEGGFYRDTDYEVFHSLRPFHETCDFYAAFEPDGCFVGNACFGARAGHPILQKALNLIERNFRTELKIKQKEDNRLPLYIQQNQGNPVFSTGPYLLSVASGLEIAGPKEEHQKQNIDVIFPAEVFYPYAPLPGKELFLKDISDPKFRYPLDAMGVHYWASSWH